MKLLWQATYKDGSVITEGYQNIRSTRQLARQGLNHFALITPEGEVKAEINLHDGQALFYRCYGTIGTDGGNILYHYAIGYRTKDSVYFKAVDEMGNVSEHTQFNSKWFEPTWLPEEQP